MPQFTAPDGYRLHYEFEGKGDPVVLLHGVTQSGAEWQRAGWAASLAQKHRLILVDLLGHGASDCPHERAPYRIEARAARVVHLADALGFDRFSLMGFSLGGRVAYEIAVTDPERLSKLVVLGQHALAPRTQRTALERQIHGFRAGRLEAMERGLGIRGPQRGAPVNDPEALALSLEALLEWRGAKDRLANAHVPALIAVGEEDPFFEAAAGSARAMPCAQFLSCGSMGHVQSFYRPDGVVHAVSEFLDLSG